MNITTRQAIKIRKAISKVIGSKKRFLPYKAVYVIEDPLTNPKLRIDVSNKIPKPPYKNKIYIKAGYNKAQRVVPTIETLKQLDFIEVNGTVIFLSYIDLTMPRL